MKLTQKIVITILMIFGLLTLFVSSSVIFDLFGIREKEGNFVQFIVWANFFCSLLYLVAVWGFIKRYSWTTYLLAIATLIVLISFAGLLIHINQGGIYETKTIFAMLFRITITIVFTIFSWKYNTKRISTINDLCH